MFTARFTGILLATAVCCLSLAAGLLYADGYHALRVPPHREITLIRDGVALRGDFYAQHDAEAPGKLVILCHSSDRLGRNSPVMRALAAELAAHHPVLSIDQRGFGNSMLERPVRSARDLDWVGDLAAWVEAAGERWGYAPEHIVLIGHSTGAGVINAYFGRYPERAHSAVLITPPRADKLAPEVINQEKFFVWWRWSHGIDHPELPPAVAREIAREIRLENLADNIHDRKVLLIDTPRTMASQLLVHEVAASAPLLSTYLAPYDVDHYFGTDLDINRRLSTHSLLRTSNLLLLDDTSIHNMTAVMETFLARKTSLASRQLAGRHFGALHW